MASSFQDGWYAWTVCAASFFVQAVYGGLLNSMGVLYIMFQNGLDAGHSAISLVTSINIGISCLVCPVVGMASERFGERPIAMLGAGLVTAGLGFSSFSTKVYHLYITYSILGGIGMGMIYNTSISILSKYFSKYKRIATGISVCGGGVGSFVLPIVIKSLEDAYGWRGALLMIGGIYAQNIILASLYKPVPKDFKREQTFPGYLEGDTTVNKRIVYKKSDTSLCKRSEEKQIGVKHPQSDDFTVTESQMMLDNDQMEKNTKDLISDVQQTSCRRSNISLTQRHLMTPFKKAVSLFKSPAFLSVCLHTTVLFFSIVAVYTHFGSYTLSIGFSRNDVALLYMAVGIATTITRVLLGIVTELTNANSLVIMMVSSVIAGGLTIVLPFTKSLIFLYIYAVSFGALISPWNTLCLPVTMDLVPQSQVATAFGVICLFSVPGLMLGAPLAAWVHELTRIYASSFYLAGSLYLLSAVIMVPSLWKSIKTRKPKHSDVSESRLDVKI